VIDIFISQIGDLFRIVLLIGVLIAQIRAEAIIGRLAPLAGGLVLVAALVPLVLPAGNVGFFSAFFVGLVTNALILAVLYGGWTAQTWLRGRR